MLQNSFDTNDTNDFQLLVQLEILQTRAPSMKSFKSKDITQNEDMESLEKYGKSGKAQIKKINYSHMQKKDNMRKVMDENFKTIGYLLNCPSLIIENFEKASSTVINQSYFGGTQFDSKNQISQVSIKEHSNQIHDQQYSQTEQIRIIAQPKQFPSEFKVKQMDPIEKAQKIETRQLNPKKSRKIAQPSFIHRNSLLLQKQVKIDQQEPQNKLKLDKQLKYTSQAFSDQNAYATIGYVNYKFEELKFWVTQQLTKINYTLQTILDTLQILKNK